MKILTGDQRSPEWFAARIGYFTASRAADMMAQIKTGEAAARRDLRLQIVLERITGVSQETGYVNADMLRGIDVEPVGIAAYEAATGHLVSHVGFLAHDTLRAGCSPDGLIGNWDGGLELKCPKSATHLSYLRGKAIPKEYQYQMMMAMWITRAHWWDFASFDDRFPPKLQLFVARLQRNEADIAAFELLTRQFLTEVDKEVDELARLAGLMVV